MVSTMQQGRQEGSVSKDMVKEVLVEVRERFTIEVQGDSSARGPGLG